MHRCLNDRKAAIWAFKSTYAAEKGKIMNGYKKMKRLAGMKVLKVLSAVTAVSMTVTSLAVATSANSVTPDVIANALGDLRNYGIVADSFTSANHFESNFAAHNVILNNDFSVDNYVINGDRTVKFKVTTEESFVKGEIKRYTFGVFCGSELIDVIYGGETQKGILTVEFDEAGEKTFTITIPEEYRYETLRIYKMDAAEGEHGVQYTSSESGVELIPEASSREEMIKKASTCVIGSSFKINSVMIGENKIMKVTPPVYENIVLENDGRYSYKQGEYSYIIANRSNQFINTPEANETIDSLLDKIREASDTLGKIKSGSSKVIFGEIDSSIEYGSEDEKKINELYQKIKDNPELSLLINVKLGDASAFAMRFHSCIDNWDVDAGSRIVFNFIGGVEGVTTIYLGDGFRGTVIAPDTRVINESTVLGAVYASEVSNPGGEIHKATYGGFCDSYQAYYYDSPEITTVPVTTTTPVEVTTTEEVTVPEETTPEETTTEEITTEETTTTTVNDATDEQTTTPAPVVTTTPAPVVTTTPAPVVTTTPAPVVTTTPAPVVTTTPAPVVTTTPAPVVTTTPAPVVTTTPAPVVTTTPAPVVTTTPAPVVTTTVEAVETTPAAVEDETTPAPVDTVPEAEETTVPEETETTTLPEIVEEPTETTTTVLIEIEEDIPRDELILIDEDIPLGDTPFATGVDNHIGLFITIGGLALLIGIGAQVYTVILKKNNN